jgi:hypothetical protein
MPKKQRGTGLTKQQPKKAKKVVRQEQLPSLPAEEVLLPVDGVAENKECLPNGDFHVDNGTRTILQATSNECPTLNAQATRLAIVYQYLTVLGAPPPEEWDGRDSTVK